MELNWWQVETNGSATSTCSSLVRKKLTFDDADDASDASDALSNQSWFRQASDSGGWLNAVDLQLSQDDASDANDAVLIKDAYRLVYDKEKVHKLVTAAEQMVSAGSKPEVQHHQQHQQQQEEPLRNYNAEEGDASSELTSGDESQPDVERNRKLASLLSSAAGSDAGVVLRNRQRSRTQRPWSLSAVEATSTASWALLSTSETGLNRLGGGGGGGGGRMHPHPHPEGLAAAATLSSGGSASGGVRQRRRRRPSARLRTAHLMSRRGVDFEVRHFRFHFRFHF